MSHKKELRRSLWVGARVKSFGLRVWGFRVWGLWVSGLWVSGSGLRV